MSRPLYTTDIKSIGDLTEVSTLSDSANLLIQSGTNFYKLTGARLASYYINGSDYKIILGSNTLGIEASIISLSAGRFNFGYYGTVSKFGGIHFGWDGIVDGFFSTHFGLSGLASGYGAFHTGLQGEATGFASFCGGWYGKAHGLGSTHFGLLGLASDEWSTHFGWSGSATGKYTTHTGAFGIVNGIRGFHSGFQGHIGLSATNSAHFGNSGRIYKDTSFHTGSVGRIYSTASLHAGIGGVLSGDTSTHFGRYGKTTMRSEIVQSSGTFSVVGDAQASTVVVRNATSDGATEKELFLDGTGQSLRLKIPSGNSWFFNAKVVARDLTLSASASYTIEGCIDNWNGSVVMTDPAVVTTISDGGGTLSTCVVSAYADDVNDSLKIGVTGVAGSTIRWVSKVDLVQTGLF